MYFQRSLSKRRTLIFFVLSAEDFPGYDVFGFAVAL